MVDQNQAVRHLLLVSYWKGCLVMLRKMCCAVVLLFGLVTSGCQTPYGGGCAGGCCGGSCAVAPQSNAAYYPPPQNAYAPAPQQQMLPPAVADGSGSR